MENNKENKQIDKPTEGLSIAGLETFVKKATAESETASTKRLSLAGMEKWAEEQQGKADEEAKRKAEEEAIFGPLNRQIEQGMNRLAQTSAERVAFFEDLDRKMYEQDKAKLSNKPKNGIESAIAAMPISTDAEVQKKWESIKDEHDFQGWRENNILQYQARQAEEIAEVLGIVYPERGVGPLYAVAANVLGKGNPYAGEGGDVANRQAELMKELGLWEQDMTKEDFLARHAELSKEFDKYRPQGPVKIESDFPAKRDIKWYETMMSEQALKDVSPLIKEHMSDDGTVLLGGKSVDANALAYAMANERMADIHNYLMDIDKHYFNLNFEKTYGKTFEQYVNDTMAEEFEKLLTRYKQLAEDYKRKKVDSASNKFEAGLNSMGVPKLLQKPFVKEYEMELGWAIDSSLDDVIEEMEAAKASGNWSQFWKGADAGFDLYNTLTFGLNELVNAGSKHDLYEKKRRIDNGAGETWSYDEELLYELFKAEDRIRGLADELGYKKSGWAKLGEGLGTTAEILPQFALSMGGTSGIFAGAKYGAAQAAKRFMVNKTIANAGRLALQGGKDLLKWSGVNYVRGMAGAPMMPMFYKGVLDEYNSQYHFEGDNLVFTSKNKASIWVGSYIDAVNEIASEHFGAGFGDVVGLGLKGAGRVLGINKVANKTVTGAVTRKVLQAPMKESTKKFLKNLGFSGSFTGEWTGEMFGDFMSQWQRYMVGAEYDFEHFKDFDSWLTTIGVSAIMGGTMTTLGGAITIYQESKAVKDIAQNRERIINSKIQDAALRDKLRMLSEMDDPMLAASELATFFQTHHIENASDRAYALDYIMLNSQLKVLMGDVQEQERMVKFEAKRAEIEGKAYHGADGKSTRNVIIVRDAEGNAYYVLRGDIANKEAMLELMDVNTGEMTTKVASAVMEPVSASVDSLLINAYGNMFSLEEEVGRVKDVTGALSSVEEPTMEHVETTAMQLDITLPKKGDVVTMVDGRTAEITEDLGDGTYIAQRKANLTGESETITLPFDAIRSNDSLTAKAQEAILNNGVESTVDATSTPQPTAEVQAPVESTTPQPTIQTPSGVSVGAVIVAPNGEQARVVEINDDGTVTLNYNLNEGASMADAAIEVVRMEELTKADGSDASANVPTTAQTEIPAPAVPQPVAETPTTDAVDAAQNVEVVPTQKDGTVDFDAIEDPVQCAQMMAAMLGGPENALAIVEESIEAVKAEMDKAVKAKAPTINEGVAKQNKINEIKTRLIRYEQIAFELEQMMKPTEAKTEAKAESVEHEAGLVENEHTAGLPEGMRKSIDEMAKRAKVRIVFVDERIKGDAEQKGNLIRVSTRNRTKAVEVLVGHELLHYMKSKMPEAYKAFKEAVIAFIGKDKFAKEVERRKKAYAAQNVELDDEAAAEEIVADYAGYLVQGRDVFEKFIEPKKSDNVFLRGLKKGLEYIRNIFGANGMTKQVKAVDNMVDALNTLINATVDGKDIEKREETTAETTKSEEAKGEDGKTKTKHSLKAQPSLVGVHNISLDKLRKVIKMGGLANPSVAVIDVDKQTHDDYGEYSLILPKNMVDARQGKNAGTWAGDAWTPTYPQIIKRMKDNKAYSRFHKDIEALPEAMRNRVRLDFDSFMDGRDVGSLAYWYLYEKGFAPALVETPSRYSDEVINALSEATNGTFNLYNLTPEALAKCLDVYIEAEHNGDKAAYEAKIQERKERLMGKDEAKVPDRVRKWAQEKVNELNEYGFDYGEVLNFVRDVESDARKRGTVDVEATIRAAKDQIKAENLNADYDTWLESLDVRYGIKEYIFNGYTNNGDRKYLPHTVENASKWMKKQGRNGAVATFPSFGVFIANAIPKMTTLESIRKRKEMLGKSKEEFEAFKDKWLEVYHELGNKLQPDAKGFDDYGYWRLIEAVGKNNPKEFIKKEYGIELSEEDMTKFNDMVNAIRTEYPARYFETKFERPLQLSDFTAAVVPNDIPLDVESRLKDAGVEVIEYERGDNASRAEAMQKASAMEGVRFSLQLPKEEYAKLSSTIMTRQHTYGKPSFDYAFTSDNFYVYDYLGDGDSIINFAIPIIGNEDLITNIETSIDNGTITSSGSLNTFVKEIQSGKRGDINYNANAFKKYERYRGIHIHIPSSADNYSGGVSEVGGIDSGRSTRGGASWNANESANQELNTKHSLITPEMDASYLEAVERGDMTTAQRLVMEAAEKAGYINDESWRMNHRAPRKDEENANPFNTEKIVPEDFWEHPEWYTNIRHSSETRESYYAMKPAIDRYKRLMAEGKTEEAENVTITMYRGVDKTANKREASFRNGDWITPSRSYALLSAPYGKARVISQEVKLKDIWWDGNSINEWGYDDGANYGYRDTKNNRKLLDPVTYDDAGNIIPLSERFNPKKEDIRYSLRSMDEGMAILRNKATEYNIDIPFILVENASEYVAMMKEMGIKNAEKKARAFATYIAGERLICFNGSHFLDADADFIENAILHEYTHHATAQSWDEVIALVATMNRDDILWVRDNMLTEHYNDIPAETTINEIISTFVENMDAKMRTAAFKGEIDIAKVIEAGREEIANDTEIDDKGKGVLISTLPLVAKALEFIKQKYNGERETAFVLRRDAKNRANGSRMGKESETKSQESTMAMRDGDGRDREYSQPDRNARKTGTVDTRYSLSDIPFFEDEGNAIDMSAISEAKALEMIDGRVRDMMAYDYDKSVVAITNQAKRDRRATRAYYAEERRKRRGGNEVPRTNAAKIDEIFADANINSLPLEVQAVIFIAEGRAKIRWANKGNQRGLGAELGLSNSPSDRAAFKNIWSGAEQSFDEVVHGWWESINGYERGIDTQDLRNALIEALMSFPSAKAAMRELQMQYDTIATAEREALEEIDRREAADLERVKREYEERSARFEMSEGDEREAMREMAVEHYSSQPMSAADEALEELTDKLNKMERKAERLMLERKSGYRELAESIEKSKEVIIRTLEHLRMFSGMEQIHIDEVAKLIAMTRTARSKRQVEAVATKAKNLIQRIAIRKARENMRRLLDLKLSNVEVIQQILKESNTLPREERDALLKSLWKVSRNGWRATKAVHPDTKEIFKELNDLIKEYKKSVKDKEVATIKQAITDRLASLEAELHPDVEVDDKGNVIDNAGLPTDFNDSNRNIALHLFKSYLEVEAKNVAYSEAIKTLREAKKGSDDYGAAVANMYASRDAYLSTLKQYNATLEDVIVNGKDKLRDFNIEKEKHEIALRSMAIKAIGGKKASAQGKRGNALQLARAAYNISVNSPYWTFETVLERIDRLSPYKKGEFYNYFMRKYTDANAKLYTSYSAHMESIGSAMARCFPDMAKQFGIIGRNPYEIYKAVMRKAEATALGTLKYMEGGVEREMQLTVANAMYIVAMWRQPRYREAMEANGITEGAINNLMQSINKEHAGYINFMDWVNTALLPNTRLEYDEVYRKLNGGSLAKEENYFPARVVTHEDVKLDENGKGQLPSSPSALKERISHKTMPQMGTDYFKVLEAHIQDMDKWAAFAELTADLNVILSSDEFRRRLNEFMPGIGGDGGGKGSLYKMLYDTALIATGNYHNSGENVFGLIQKTWATSNIAFRYWTAVKQISSVSVGITEHIYFAKHMGIASTVAGIAYEWKRAMEISPSLRYRWQSRAAGMEALMRETSRGDGYARYRGGVIKTYDALKDMADKAVKLGMTPNALIDAIACSILVNSVYDKAIHDMTKGKREATEEERKEAIRKAEIAFNSTQQSSEGAYLSAAQANPLYAPLTTYMNASYALHRKRMSGIHELWKLMTSKEYGRFLKDEYGVDAAKISAKDAFADIIRGIVGDLSFAAMGWGLMEVMSAVYEWLGGDGDEDDTEAEKQAFFETWWMPALNGLLGGGVVTSIFQGFDTSFTPAYDEALADVKGLFDDKGDWRVEVAQFATKYGLGIDIKSLYRIGAGLENMVAEEDGENAGSILMFLNAPNKYIKAFVGDRREGETMEQYQTRIMRLYTLFDKVMYEELFDENGNYIGEGAPSMIMSQTQAEDLNKEYEVAFLKDVVVRNGGWDEYKAMMNTEMLYKDICEFIGVTPDAKPSKVKLRNTVYSTGEYVEPVDGLTEKEHDNLLDGQGDIYEAHYYRTRWMGDDEGYYDLLKEEYRIKNELIDKYNEYIK